MTTAPATNPLTKGGNVAMFIDDEQQLESQKIQTLVEALLHSKEGTRLQETLNNCDTFLPTPNDVAPPREKGVRDLKYVPNGEGGFWPEKAALALFIKNVSEVSPTMRAEPSAVALKKPDRQEANFNAFDIAVSKLVPEIQGKCGVAAFLRAVLALSPSLGTGNGVDEKDVAVFNEFAGEDSDGLEEEKEEKKSTGRTHGLGLLESMQAPRPPSQAKLACFDQAFADNVLLRMDWAGVESDDCGLLTRRDFKLIAEALDKLGSERKDQRPWADTFAGYIRSALTEIDAQMDESENAKDEALNFYLSGTKRDEKVLAQLSHGHKRHDKLVPDKDYAFLSFVQSMCRLKHLLQKFQSDPLRTLITAVPSGMRSYLPTYLVKFQHGTKGGRASSGESSRRQPTFLDRTEWMECDRQSACGPEDASLFSYEQTARLKTIVTPGGFGYALRSILDVLNDSKKTVTAATLFTSMKCKRVNCPRCLDLFGRVSKMAATDRASAAKYVGVMYNVCRRIAEVSVNILSGQTTLVKTGRLPRDRKCAPLGRFYSAESLLRAQREGDDEYVTRACAASLLVRLKGLPARNLWCDFWRDMSGSHPKERIRFNMRKVVYKHESLVSRLHVSGQIAHMLDTKGPLPEAEPVEPQQAAIGVCVYEAVQRLQSSIVFYYTVALLGMLCRNARATPDTKSQENLLAQAREEVRKAMSSEPFRPFEDALDDNLSHLKRDITGRDVLVHATQVTERRLRRRVYGREEPVKVEMPSIAAPPLAASTSSIDTRAMTSTVSKRSIAQRVQPAAGRPPTRSTSVETEAPYPRTDVLMLVQKYYVDCMRDLCEVWVAPRSVKVDTLENERKKALRLAEAVSSTFADCLESLDTLLFRDFDLDKVPAELKKIELSSAKHPGYLDAARVALLRRRPLTALSNYLSVCEETGQSVVTPLLKLLYATFDQNRYLGNCALSEETSGLVVLLKAVECSALRLVVDLMSRVQHMEMNTC